MNADERLVAEPAGLDARVVIPAYRIVSMVAIYPEPESRVGRVGDQRVSCSSSENPDIGIADDRSTAVRRKTGIGC